MCRRGFLDGRRGQRGIFRQAADRLVKLLRQIAVAADAVAFAGIERVFRRKGAKHHLGMVVKVAVDRDLNALDGKRGNAQPFGIGVVGRLAGRTFAKEQDIRHHGGSFAFEGVGGQADCPDEVRFGCQVFADSGILLVHREMAT